MKGKKIISAALAGVMALSLTACGGGSTQETTAAPAADSKAEETTAAAEGSEAATGEGVAKEDLKVGFIFIGDENEGYTAAHYKGAKEMQEALGLNDDQLIVKWNIPEDETAKDAAMDLADQGCQIVFANSFGHESYVIEAANIRKFSSVTQPVSRQQAADFPICTTSSHLFLRHATYLV